MNCWHEGDCQKRSLSERCERRAITEHWAEEGRRAAAMYGLAVVPCSRCGSDARDGLIVGSGRLCPKCCGLVCDAINSYAPRPDILDTLAASLDRQLALREAASLVREFVADETDECVVTTLEQAAEHIEMLADSENMHREPTPGYVPAVRRVPGFKGGSVLREDPESAYVDAADSLMRPCASSIRLLRRCEERSCTLEADGHWLRVRDRLAAILRAQDRKHGGGA